ncbi:Uncharacterised protein [Vibrio cholerae]|nr:Uncharacterised protein [Vibrio cholerae]
MELSTNAVTTVITHDREFKARVVFVVGLDVFFNRGSNFAQLNARLDLFQCQVKALLRHMTQAFVFNRHIANQKHF